ncbi:MAG: co-chaperone GroES [bacterium]
MASLKPLGDKVLVRPAKKESVSKGGIVLPDSIKDKPQEGIVISTGPGKVTDDGKTVAVAVKPGDKILFTKYGPTEVKIDGEDLFILDERDILGVYA